MSPRRAWMTLIPTLVLSACDSLPDHVPGSVPPGSIDAVTQEIAGGVGGNGHALDALGVLPVGGSVPATIPLIRPPQVILFYCFPRKSRDGLAWRNGVWIARVITPFSWGVDDSMHQDALQLRAMSSLRLDSQGQLVADRQEAAEPPADSLAGLSALAAHLPWRPGSEPATTRTTVIYPSSGQAVTTQSSGSSPYVRANGSVNLQEVQKAMAAASQRLRDSQLQHGPVPVPGTALPAGSGTTNLAASADTGPAASIPGDGN